MFPSEINLVRQHIRNIFIAFFLFKNCDLFNGTLSSSDNIALNDGMINKERKWKAGAMAYFEKRLGKTTKNLSQSSWCLV
jgi:hypothetical protein